MGKKNKGPKQQNASNSKEKSTKTQQKSPNSSLEEGEIREAVEETDPGHSSSTNSTPDKLPLATALPLQESTDGNTGEENGSEKKQGVVSNTDTTEGNNGTSSGRKEIETPTEDSETSNLPPPPPDWDISTPLTELGTCGTEAIASQAVNGSSNARKGPTIKDHAQLTDVEILAECTLKTNLPPTNTITKILVGNISSDTTENDLTQLFGLRTTPELKKNVRIKLISDRTHKFRRYALIEGPRLLMNTIVPECNGHIFNNRKLEIEFDKSDKSVLPLGKRDLQRKGFNKATAQTSGHKTKVGDLRPVSSASSRPEDSAPCTNGEQGEPIDANPEVVGEAQTILSITTNPWRNTSEANITDKM